MPEHRQPAVRSRAWLRPLLTILALLSVCASVTQADDVTIDAVFGWSGQTPTDRWAPMTVYIHSPEHSISGTMLIEYTQDAHQRASIAAPFAVVAGQTAAHQAVISLAPACDSVKITLLDQRGRRIAAEEFTSSYSPRAGSLGTPRPHANGLLVCIGVPGLVDSMRALQRIENARRAETTPGVFQLPSNTEQDRWGQVLATSVQVADLPLSAMAWDGVMALIVDGDAAMQVNRAALDAVHQWVRSGGRLVVVANGPGDQWRAWLPDEARHMLDLGPPTRSALPAEIAAAIRDAPAPPDREGPDIEPVETVLCRAVDITRAGFAEGWTASLAADDEVHLLAEGPAGFGFITILGFDPYRTTRTISSHAAGAVWKRSLDRIGGEFFAMTRAGHDPYYGQGVARSQSAINEALESLANIPVLGYMTFILILASMAMLALLVGPIDYLFLRRRRSLHRSWLTALLWVAVAAGAGIAAPRLIRSDPNQINRLAVIDQFSDPSRDAFTTGLTGIYAGHPGTFRPLDIDPASWWRGTSAIYYYQSGAAMSRISTVQGAVGGERGSTRSNLLAAVPMAQWTFRTLLDQSITSPLPISVDLDGDEQSGILTISKLPPGAAIESVILRQGGQAVRVVPLEGAADVWQGTYASGSSIDASRLEFRPGEGRAQNQDDRLMAIALSLPGPDARQSSIEARLASGHWALACIQITSLPPYPTLQWDAIHEHRAIVRILIPREAP